MASFSTIAADLLDAVVAALGTDTPPHSFVSHNAPAWDLCREDQVSVFLSGLLFRQSGRPQLKARQSLPAPTWTIQLVRCVPNVDDQGRGPTDEALTTSALGLLDDLDAIQAAVRADTDGIFGGCRSVSFGQAIPLGPQGNVGGYSWPITAEV